MTTYYLQRCRVRALPERELVRCHLQGVGSGRWRRTVRHEEFVNLPLREHEPLPETIRRAVFASPRVWRVSLAKNLFEFDGKFYQPVREQAAREADLRVDSGAERCGQTYEASHPRNAIAG